MLRDVHTKNSEKNKSMINIYINVNKNICTFLAGRFAESYSFGFLLITSFKSWKYQRNTKSYNTRNYLVPIFISILLLLIYLFIVYTQILRKDKINSYVQTIFRFQSTTTFNWFKKNHYIGYCDWERNNCCRRLHLCFICCLSSKQKFYFLVWLSRRYHIKVCEFRKRLCFYSSEQ